MQQGKRVLSSSCILRLEKYGKVKMFVETAKGISYLDLVIHACWHTLETVFLLHKHSLRSIPLELCWKLVEEMKRKVFVENDLHCQLFAHTDHISMNSSTECLPLLELFWYWEVPYHFNRGRKHEEEGLKTEDAKESYLSRGLMKEVNLSRGHMMNNRFNLPYMQVTVEVH